MEKRKTGSASKHTALRLTLCAMFTAITAVLSQIAIPIGPVPISCSLIAVYLSGLLLSPKLAFLSQVVYLLLGALGVPVFANFGAGLARLAGPTGGYLVVYPILSVFIAFLMRQYDEKIQKKYAKHTSKAKALSIAYVTGVLFLALLLCYATGTLWFCVYAGSTVQKALALTVLPFLAGDGIKILFCVLIVQTLRPLFIKQLQKYKE